MAVEPIMTNRSAAIPMRNRAVTSNAASGSSDGTGSSSGSSESSIEESFMQLLVAQMQNQDPTNPMDNNQLTSQLAQFNTASGVNSLNTTLNAVGGVVLSMEQMEGSSWATEWVGRDVLVEGVPTVSTKGNKYGNKYDVTGNVDEGGCGGSNDNFGLSLDGDADKVTVTLTDDDGNAYTGTLKSVKAGVHQYSLNDLSDFKPSDPRGEADKTFKVSLSATDADGNDVKITALKSAKVQGVSFSTAGTVLELGNGETAELKDVHRVE